MDDLAALRLQIEWGADEALQDIPVDRFALPPAANQRPQPPLPPPDNPLPPSRTPPKHRSGCRNRRRRQGPPSPPESPRRLQRLPPPRHRLHTVAPRGNPAAPLILIGEAPGPDDDRAGIAFSGAPGARLDRVLGSIGLTPESLLLTLLIPWRPPGGRPVNDTELALCLPFIHRLVALARPKHLILCGTLPLRALGFQDTTLRKARGKFLPVTIPGLDAPIPALPMLPPDLMLSSPQNRQMTWADLLTLHQALSPPL